METDWINIYKIGDHIAVTGPGTKLIKDVLKNKYEARWEKAPFNLWLISDITPKKFMRNKTISKTVRVLETTKSKKPISAVDDTIQQATKQTTNKQTTNKQQTNKQQETILEKKEEKNLNNIYELLPQETIKEIIDRMDDQGVASFLSTAKNLYKIAPEYKTEILKQAIERELKYTFPRYKKYYTHLIYDFKPGDRIIYNGSELTQPAARATFGSLKNYKVISIKGKTGLVQHVDMLGNPLNDQLEPIKIEKDYRGLMQWYKAGHYPQYGILLYDNGPQIESPDSKYLKYKTIPNASSMNIKPEVGMLTLVTIGKPIAGNPQYFREYVITDLTAKTMTLEYVGDYPNAGDYGRTEPVLYAEKINNDWVILNNDDYIFGHTGIFKNGFGVFGEGYSDNIPF